MRRLQRSFVSGQSMGNDLEIFVLPVRGERFVQVQLVESLSWAMILFSQASHDCLFLLDAFKIGDQRNVEDGRFLATGGWQRG